MSLVLLSFDARKTSVHFARANDWLKSFSGSVHSVVNGSNTHQQGINSIGAVPTIHPSLLPHGQHQSLQALGAFLKGTQGDHDICNIER